MILSFHNAIKMTKTASVLLRLLTADDNSADSGTADADITAKAENALDSSPKCGDTFLFGWLFKLLGIAN